MLIGSNQVSKRNLNRDRIVKNRFKSIKNEKTSPFRPFLPHYTEGGNGAKHLRKHRQKSRYFDTERRQISRDIFQRDCSNKSLVEYRVSPNISTVVPTEHDDTLLMGKNIRVELSANR